MSLQDLKILVLKEIIAPSYLPNITHISEYTVLSQETAQGKLMGCCQHFSLAG